MAYGDHAAAPYIGLTVTYALSQEEYNRYGVQSVPATVTFISTATCINLQAVVNVPARWQKSAPITNFSITSNLVTFTANELFVPGDIVTISGLSVGTYLNGQTLTVISASGTQFTAVFTHANVGATSDNGTAQQIQATLEEQNVTFDSSGSAQRVWYNSLGAPLPGGSPW